MKLTQEQSLEAELTRANARIAELESQREHWRMSSVCREKDAQIAALWGALDKCRMYIHRMPVTTLEERELKKGAILALSAPPPPVVPKAIYDAAEKDAEELADALVQVQTASAELQRRIKGEMGGKLYQAERIEAMCAKALKAHAARAKTTEEK